MITSLMVKLNAMPKVVPGKPLNWKRVALFALVVIGALVTSTIFGSTAYAQIAFRSASSATAGGPQFRSATSATLSTPAFRASASAGTTGATLTISLPAGTVANDVMIASVAVRPAGATITAPAGWTLVRRTDNTNATSNSLATYRKVAGAAEPANYSWTFTGVSDAAGGIQSFNGVDTANPIDVENGNCTLQGSCATGTLSHATPSVTTTVANSMVVTSHAFASAETWTPPAGMTESFDRASRAVGNSPAESIEGNRVLQAARGATGTKTATVGNNGDVGNAHILALKPGLVINVPAGVVANDVMVASVGVSPSTATITAPAGWTVVRRIDNATATSNSLVVYSKVAGGSEPASYTWTVQTADYVVGGIQAFFNVDTANPIDVENGQATPSALNHTALSVTTSVPNTILVTSHTYSSSRAWTAPGGMTESFDQLSGAAGANGQSIEGNRKFIATAGATGANTASAAANPQPGNTHTLALKSTRSVLTINVPAGTVANDVMIASITVQTSATVVTPPVGWTLVRQTDNATAPTGSLYVYRRVAGGAEPASYTWTTTNLAYAAGGIQSFSGVDTTTPIDVENGAATASALTHATPSVTTTVASTMVVTTHAIASSATWTPPAGMTEAFDTAVLTVPNANGQAIGGNYVAQAAAGASGVKTATASNNADPGITHILALRPNSAVTTPGNFNAYDSATAAGAISGFIKTKIAGSTISLDIVALNSAKTALLTTFAGTVRVEVLDASNNTGALDPNGCRPTWTLIQTLPDPALVAADNGRKTVSFTQANTYRDVRLRISYPAGAPTVTGCSNDDFAIRPNTFANFAVTDTDWQTAGTGRALNDATFGAVTHKAGRPLSVRASAVNAAGAPGTTTNYVGSPSATLTACAGAACTATFGNLTLTTTFVAGQLVSDTGSYDNAGSFQLQLVDSTFAAVDGADGSTAAERNITSAAISVGRFVPDHFAVSLNTPVFGTACGSFTYIGQTFNYTTAPVVTVTAQDFANNTTTLYATAGSWWRITNASLTSKTYAAATGTLDTSAVPGTDPVIVAAGAGVGTLTFSSGTGLLFTRTTPPVPAPYNADISLAINVIDADGVIYASNPASFGAATAGNGIAFSSGKPMRFGRLRLSNASGSQLISMPIRMETQYWNGAAFVTSADTCTSISTANVALGNYQKNLNSGETTVASVGAFSGGLAWLRLSAPGAANNGSVDVSVNLTGAGAGNSCTASMAASTGSGLSHLQGAWCGAPYGRDPTARATFGVNTNTNQMIYQRENF
jgi:hypothetical protein